VKGIDMTNRCAIYSRCSTDDQTVLNQILELKKIAQRKGFQIVAEFSDEGISGVKGRDIRTGFDNLIKVAVKKDFDTILVWSVDRLHLNSLLHSLLNSSPN
jgi:DNA invertase Pin-like site-specific DNA recombinase